MVDPFFEQVAWTGLAILVLVAAAACLSVGRPSGPLNELRARALLAEAFPDRPVETVWLGIDGKAALAKSGGLGLVLCAVGETFSVRQIPWGQALASSFRSGVLLVNLADDDGPRTRISLTSWPPQDLAA